MDEPTECGQISDLLAEMATGGISGPDRACVMRHLVICDGCWDQLTDLTRVADEALLAAPEHEPRAGFETAVLDRIAALQPDDESTAAALSSRWRRGAAFVLAAAVAALGGAGVVWQVTSDEREVAAGYRDTLEVADGKYFAADDLVAADGSSTGTVFMYEGNPSWLFVVVRDAPDGVYDVRVETDHTNTAVGEITVRSGTGSFGVTIDAHVSDVNRIILDGRDAQGVKLTATHQVTSW